MALVIALTSGTPLAPKRYERHLLAQYQRGDLTIDEVIECLDLSVYHVAYRSRATPLPTDELLQNLLAWSRDYNARHQITGLLLHSGGRFVQVLEGAEADVRALFARIQQDARHTQVVTLSEGPGPHRHFPNWHMEFGLAAPDDLDLTLAAVAAQAPELIPPLKDANLRALLRVVGVSAGE